MPAVCLLEACLEASDVGALLCEAHPCGGGPVGGGQVAVPKGRPALRGLQLCGVGVVCRVEECVEWVRCSFPSAEGGVELAASDRLLSPLVPCPPTLLASGLLLGGPGVVGLGGVGHGGGGTGRGGCGGPPRSSGPRCGIRVGCGGVWFGLGQGLCRTPWPMVNTRLCADTTGLGESRLSGPKACRTVDRPRTPWWHTREGDAAVPVCVARAGQEGGACMLVVLAGHDGSHGCAAPGPARWRRCRSSVSGFPRCGLVRPCRRL